MFVGAAPPAGKPKAISTSLGKVGFVT